MHRLSRSRPRRMARLFERMWCGTSFLVIIVLLTVVCVHPSASKSTCDRKKDGSVFYCLPKCCPYKNVLETDGSGDIRAMCAPSKDARLVTELQLLLAINGNATDNPQADQFGLRYDAIPHCNGAKSTGNASVVYEQSIIPFDVAEQSAYLLQKSPQLHLASMNLTFNSTQFCIDRGVDVSGTEMVAVACFPVPENEPMRVPIDKCCPPGQYLDEVTLQCRTVTSADRTWTPKFFSHETGEFANITEPVVESVGKPKCPPGKEETVLRGGSKPSFVLLNDGALWHLVNEEFYKPGTGDFCVDRSYDAANPTDLAILCVRDMCANATCVRKCCGKNFQYDVVSKTCVPQPLNNAGEFDWLYKVAPTNYRYHLLSGSPPCEYGMYTFDPDGSHRFDLFTNGDLQFKLDRKHRLNKNDYCLDVFYNDTTGLSAVNGFVCYPAPGEYDDVVPASWDTFRLFLYAGGLSVSAVFLLITLVLSWRLPEMHCLHGRSQLSHIVALFFGYTFLAIAQFGGTQLPGPICTVLGSLVHIFLLAAFFWLNVLSFNIWWTFRKMRPSGSDPHVDRKRFMFFCLYAWGVPLLISVIAIAVDYIPDENSLLAHIKPGFGQLKCWFVGTQEELIYLYGPIGILLFINVIFFTLTTKELLCGVWKKDGRNGNKQDNMGLLRICLKLFLIMGLCWLAEIISFAAGDAGTLWYITDIINTLQGVMIFWAIICRRRVWQTLQKQWLIGHLANFCGCCRCCDPDSDQEDAADGRANKNPAVRWTNGRSGRSALSNDADNSSIAFSYTT